MIQHNQATIIVNKITYQVDEKLTPLITELLKVGIQTNFSCQGDKTNPAYISIDLDSLNDYHIENNILTIHWDFGKPFKRKTAKDPLLELIHKSYNSYGADKK